MLIRIDKDADVPVYLQIVCELKSLLLAGKLTHGDELPPVRELAEMLEVNLHTVRHAYGVLASAGVVTMGLGRRTRICMRKKPADSTPADLNYFNTELGSLLFDAYWHGLEIPQIKAMFDKILNRLEKQNA